MRSSSRTWTIQSACDYWFGNVIEPVLQEKVTVDSKFYTAEEIDMVKGICDESNLSMLGTDAAFNYLLLMKRYRKHDLDVAYSLFQHHNNQFWLSVLVRVFGLQLETKWHSAYSPTNTSWYSQSSSTTRTTT